MLHAATFHFKQLKASAPIRPAPCTLLNLEAIVASGTVSVASVITPAQRAELVKITRYPGIPQAIVLRCRVVLGASQGTAH